jgi:hypothetical protein
VRASMQSQRQASGRMTGVAHSNGRSTYGDSNTALQYIDRATLTPLVRQALGSQTVEVAEWRIEQIHRGVGAHSAAASTIHRIAGVARDHDAELDWCLILKSLRPQGKGLQSSDWDYWRREVDVYQSGWLDELPGGLVTPQCFGIEESSDGTCWIWMEEVRDDVGQDWPLEHYGVVARHLGRFNGAYVAGYATPSFPWLSTGFLRGAVASAEPAVELLDQVDGHPLARRALPPDVVEMFKRLWAEREELLTALDAMPQSICHYDAMHANMFTRHTADRGEEIVVIDWALVGYGAVGIDLMPLWAHGLGRVGQPRAQQLDETVLRGYVKGLCDAGWEGDLGQVRLACGIHAAINILMYWLGQRVPPFFDDRLHAWVEQTFGSSIEEEADYFPVLPRAFRRWDLIDAARELLGLK